MKRRREETTTAIGPKWQDALAGASAGAFSKTAMAPVERVKLLMQLQGYVATEEPVGGPLQVTRRIYQNEGLLAFWRGNWPNVLRTAGQAALNFSFMDYFKSLATSPMVESAFLSVDDKDASKRRQLMVSFVSGGLAGATSTTALYPTEFLRTRLALDLGREVRQYSGMRDCLVQTIRTDGVLGVYQGYGIALWGSVLYRLLHLGGYDAIKTEVVQYKQSQHQSSQHISMGERFVIAQVVSLTAGTVCYPIDSVRRRLMMQAGKPQESRLYRGSIHCIQQVWSQEGLRGFYLGLTPNLVRSVGGALMLVVYDSLKTII